MKEQREKGERTPDAATGSLLSAPTIEKVVELFVRIHQAVVSVPGSTSQLEVVCCRE